MEGAVLRYKLGGDALREAEEHLIKVRKIDFHRLVLSALTLTGLAVFLHGAIGALLDNTAYIGTGIGVRQRGYD